jgi:hypothetical protein
MIFIGAGNFWLWPFYNQQLLVFVGGSSSAETTKEYIIRF